MRNFRSAFFRTDIFDYNSAEQWTINGAEDTYQRANKKWKQLLASYQPPTLDEGLEQELNTFITHRKNELGFAKKR
jgi:trimethylamine--corrinoid protein Co-methyltransferase